MIVEIFVAGYKNNQAFPAQVAGKALSRHVAPPLRAAAPCFWSVREDVSHNELFDLGKQFALNIVIISIFLMSDMSVIIGRTFIIYYILEQI